MFFSLDHGPLCVSRAAAGGESAVRGGPTTRPACPTFSSTNRRQGLVERWSESDTTRPLAALHAVVSSFHTVWVTTDPVFQGNIGYIAKEDLSSALYLVYKRVLPAVGADNHLLAPPGRRPVSCGCIHLGVEVPSSAVCWRQTKRKTTISCRKKMAFSMSVQRAVCACGMLTRAGSVSGAAPSAFVVTKRSFSEELYTRLTERERSQSVTSFYYQSAIDQAAGKVISVFQPPSAP